MKAVRKIENYFTLKTMQIIGAMKQSKRCRVDKKLKRIVVPRFGIYEVLTEDFGLANYTTVSQLKLGHSPSTWFKFKGNLYPNQELILKYMLKTVYTDVRKKLGSAGCILNLEAGQGKSYIAAYLMSIFNKKTLIILHSTSMIKQWANIIYECYDDITIGYYYGRKKTDGDVVIMVINSALSAEFKVKGQNIQAPNDYFNQFGYIIYDECHKYANTNCGKALSVAQAPYMLGLSATPDENINKFDKLVWWGIGPVLNAEDLPGYIPTDKNFKGTVHRINYYGTPEYTRLIRNVKTDMVSVSETLSMICQDNQRNKLIVQCIVQCMKKGLYTFVFADRRDYLEILRSMLIDDQKTTEDTAEIMDTEADYIRIVGGAKDEKVIKAEMKARVIFTTYQFMGTGRSIVKMNGLVMSTPRKSKMKQYIKRIFRLGSDTSIERHIYDIVDMKTVLKNQWYSRKKYYTSQDFTIEEEKHDMNKKINKSGGKINKSDRKIRKSTTKVKILSISKNKNKDIP